MDDASIFYLGAAETVTVLSLACRVLRAVVSAAHEGHGGGIFYFPRAALCLQMLVSILCTDSSLNVH